MTDRVLALIALLVFGGFLGILVWKVQTPDLAAVVAVTLGLALWDHVTGGGRRPNGR